MKRTFVYSTRAKTRRWRKQSCSTSAGNVHNGWIKCFATLFMSVNEDESTEWGREYWFCHYKYILESRWIHKYRIIEYWGLTVYTFTSIILAVVSIFFPLALCGEKIFSFWQFLCIIFQEKNVIEIVIVVNTQSQEHLSSLLGHWHFIFSNQSEKYQSQWEDSQKVSFPIG